MRKTIPENPDDDDQLVKVYAGGYECGMRQNFGRFFYSPREFYAGFWHKNLREGFGCYYYAPENDRDTILLAEQN